MATYVNSSGKTVYKEDYSCVLEAEGGRGAIFIGNLEAAENLSTLKKHSIKALLTAAKGISISHPKEHVPFHLCIPAEDHDAFDISRYFNQAASFLNDALQKTNVMVHCLAGVSRSVSLVLAYLIKHQGMTYQRAYDTVKARRKIIHPNDGFIKQLRKFEESLGSRSIAEKNFRDNLRQTDVQPAYESRIKEIEARISQGAKLYDSRKNSSPQKFKHFSPQKLQGHDAIRHQYSLGSHHAHHSSHFQLSPKKASGYSLFDETPSGYNQNNQKHDYEHLHTASTHLHSHSLGQSYTVGRRASLSPTKHYSDYKESMTRGQNASGYNFYRKDQYLRRESEPYEQTSSTGVRGIDHSYSRVYSPTKQTYGYSKYEIEEPGVLSMKRRSTNYHQSYLTRYDMDYERTKFQKAPLQGIQNRVGHSDIDKKIEEIRRKYQEYSSTIAYPSSQKYTSEVDENDGIGKIRTNALSSGLKLKRFISCQE